jgi:hypothetical protein
MIPALVSQRNVKFLGFMISHAAAQERFFRISSTKGSLAGQIQLIRKGLVGGSDQEVTMATMVPNRRSTFGINCGECGSELIAPEKSEYSDGGQIRHLWLCQKCSATFESLALIRTEAMILDDIFPSLLVS